MQHKSPQLIHSFDSHCAKVQKYEQGKIISNFMICDSNDVVEHYGGKNLHCTGVLLRADITGHSQFSQLDILRQKGGMALLC